MPSSLPPIVLIDDDADDLFFATHRIGQANTRFPLLMFRDSMEAVRYFESRESHGEPPASLVFCDVKMPGLGGFEVLSRLRTLQTCQPVAIYMLSGSILETDRRRALELGATGYLVKCPTTEEIAQLLASHCSASGASHSSS